MSHMVGWRYGESGECLGHICVVEAMMKGASRWAIYGWLEV